MYVQSCCFAYSKKLLILTRCRRPCGILKSLLFITFRQFLFAQIKLRFQIDCFPQWTLPVLGWYLTHLQSKGRELLKWRYVVKWVRCHTSREIHTTWKQTQRKHECHKLDGQSQFKEDKDWNKIKVKERVAILNETQRWNSRSKILPREGSLLILVNLRNRTVEGRRRQTSCVKRDNHFVWNNFSPNFTFIWAYLFVKTRKHKCWVKITTKLVVSRLSHTSVLPSSSSSRPVAYQSKPRGGGRRETWVLQTSSRLLFSKESFCGGKWYVSQLVSLYVLLFFRYRLCDMHNSTTCVSFTGVSLYHSTYNIQSKESCC